MLDQLYVYRILYMLVTPFKDTEAFALGIIDDKGNVIKDTRNLTSEETKAYTSLHRLVFNLKRIINKAPGGESKIKNIAAALLLIKENMGVEDDVFYADFANVIEKDETPVEETIEVLDFIRTVTEEGIPANVTGPAVSTDEPVKGKKKCQSYPSDSALP